jgi:DNA-binding CsgD family transcriptional regulator
MEQASLPHRLLDVLEENAVAALVADADGRVVFWSRGASALLGREAAATVGKPCWEAVGGRDVFGNTYCTAHCPVLAMAARGEPVHPFPLVAETGGGPGREEELAVTTLRLDRPRGRPYVLHLLHPSFAARGPLVSAAAHPAAEARTAPDGQVPARVLTHREEEVLVCIRMGLQNKEIAERLAISLATVRNHVHNLLRKLEVHSKLEAAVRGGPPSPGTGPAPPSAEAQRAPRAVSWRSPSPMSSRRRNAS